MLSRPNRITRGADYKTVVRGGVRCAGFHTVTYVKASDQARAARFGFIVGRQVGSAAVRNTVRRRLKAAAFTEIGRVRDGVDVVIRALPSSATADYAALHAELARCIARRAA